MLSVVPANSKRVHTKKKSFYEKQTKYRKILSLLDKGEVKLMYISHLVQIYTQRQ